MGKLGPVVEKKIMPVETDPQKLVNHVCGSNIYTKGEDIKVSWIVLFFFTFLYVSKCKQKFIL